MTTPQYGSDLVVDLMRAAGIEYVAFNPGATFRGLHDSIVNYGGNRAPEIILCTHEEIGQAEERPAGRRLAAERPHKNDGRSSLAESARCISERSRVGLRRRRGLEPGQIR